MAGRPRPQNAADKAQFDGAMAAAGAAGQRTLADALAAPGPGGAPPDIRPGFYRHFKGGLYYVAGLARHSERREEVEVVYYSLTLGLWNRRPLASPPGTPPAERYGWLEPVEKPDYRGPRFRFLAAADFVPPPFPVEPAAAGG